MIYHCKHFCRHPRPICPDLQYPVFIPFSPYSNNNTWNVLCYWGEPERAPTSELNGEFFYIYIYLPYQSSTSVYYTERKPKTKGLGMGLHNIMNSKWLVQRTIPFLQHIYMVSKRQLSILLPEGNPAIKRQLYSEPFTLREAASFIFQHYW